MAVLQDFYNLHILDRALGRGADIKLDDLLYKAIKVVKHIRRQDDTCIRCLIWLGRLHCALQVCRLKHRKRAGGMYGILECVF
jgi:hypothetical protein